MENSRRLSFLVVKGDKIYSESEKEKSPSRIPMRKSILKPCPLRRSMSMESNDVNQKKVAFTTPKLIVDVNFIDEKMKRSYIDDKSSTMIGHRRRSFTMPNNTNYFAPKIKAVPNFKALHEQEFNKMESLAEHTQRKAERAKKLLAPNILSTAKMSEKSNFVRNSETRTPILKRSAIIPFMGPPSKIPRISAAHLEAEKKRSSINSINFVKKHSPISKITEKGGTTEPSPITDRLQLKGVRLNKRFQLQMRHKQFEESQHSR